MSRRRRYRSRQYRRTQRERRAYFAMRHIERGQELSEQLGETDEDVKRYLYDLVDEQRVAVLAAYETKHGKRKRAYAEIAIKDWKSGKKKMSGLIASRLFQLLPPLMPLSAKYSIVETLWKKYSPTELIYVSIGMQCTPQVASEAVKQHVLSRITASSIPDTLKSQFDWLSGQDVEVKEQILNYILQSERDLVIADSERRIKTISGALKGASSTTSKIHYTIGKCSIEIIIAGNHSELRFGRPAPTAGRSTGCLLIVAAWIAAAFMITWKLTA